MIRLALLLGLFLSQAPLAASAQSCPQIVANLAYCGTLQQTYTDVFPRIFRGYITEYVASHQGQRASTVIAANPIPADTSPAGILRFLQDTFESHTGVDSDFTFVDQRDTKIAERPGVEHSFVATDFGGTTIYVVTSILVGGQLVSIYSLQLPDMEMEVLQEIHRGFLADLRFNG